MSCKEFIWVPDTPTDFMVEEGCRVGQDTMGTPWTNASWDNGDQGDGARQQLRNYHRVSYEAMVSARPIILNYIPYLKHSQFLETASEMIMRIGECDDLSHEEALSNLIYLRQKIESYIPHLLQCVGDVEED